MWEEGSFKNQILKRLDICLFPKKLPDTWNVILIVILFGGRIMCQFYLFFAPVGILQSGGRGEEGSMYFKNQS